MKVSKMNIEELVKLLEKQFDNKEDLKISEKEILEYLNNQNLLS